VEGGGRLPAILASSLLTTRRIRTTPRARAWRGGGVRLVLVEERA
jgi:hypothetical protein